MNFLTMLFILILFMTTAVFSQTVERPFAELDESLTIQTGGWNGSKENLSKIFNRERIRLGEDFESSLLIYAANDTEKLFWLALFLESETYLQGSMPLPVMAQTLRNKAIKLLENDEKQAGRRLGLIMYSAVSYEKNGQEAEAVYYKVAANTILSKNQDLRTSVPAMSPFDKCIYSNIGFDSNICQEKMNEIVSKKILISGILNGKATSLPAPKYPGEAKSNKIQGIVFVRITVDENGQVISAKAIKGASALHQSAEKAALKAKFEPSKLDGNPVKVIGILQYRFAL